MTSSAPAAAIARGASPAMVASAAPFRAWRHRFAWLNLVAIWTLLVFGANVTSHDAGLAVPDWPTSLGFLNPIAVYLLGLVRDLVAYEHNHRVAGMVVGLLVIVQAVWLWRTAERRHQRVMGLLLLLAVSVQGVLGGLTVRMRLPAVVSVFHGVFAQSILGFAVATACVLSREWRDAPTPASSAGSPSSRALRRAALVACAAVWLQLVLGAIVRHTSAKERLAQFGDLPVIVHMSFAAVAFFAIGTLVSLAQLEPRRDGRLRRPAQLLGLLLLLQIPLGILAVVKGSDPAATVLHVMTGATILALVVFLTLRAFRLRSEQAS